MGLTAEKVAQQWKVSREDQDAFAVESHRRAIAAIQSGAFANEITRWTPPTARPTWPPAKILRNKVLDTDEGPRLDTTLEGLAKLKPCSTPGQRHRRQQLAMSDGAGAVVLVSERCSSSSTSPRWPAM